MGAVHIPVWIRHSLTDVNVIVDSASMLMDTTVTVCIIELIVLSYIKFCYCVFDIHTCIYYIFLMKILMSVLIIHTTAIKSATIFLAPSTVVVTAFSSLMLTQECAPHHVMEHTQPCLGASTPLDGRSLTLYLISAVNGLSTLEKVRTTSFVLLQTTLRMVFWAEGIAPLSI